MSLTELKSLEMKILVVMSNYPFPPRTGSSIVAFNSLKFLSKNHSVDLVCLRPMDKIIHPAEYVDYLDVIEHAKFSVLIKWMRYFFYILLGKPPSISSYASKAMNLKIQKKIKEEKYDILLLFEMSAIQYCPATCFHRLVVNIEDPQSIKIDRMAQLPILSPLQKFKLLALSKFTAHYENQVLHKVAKVLLLSKADVQDMNRYGSFTNLAHVPYGVHEKNSSDILSFEDRDKIILYSGNMFHPPNVDGILFFISDILPLILQVHPTTKLQIVGADPDSRIYKAAAIYGKQIVITGKVASVDNYIRRAAVSVCPVRLKIGVQTKILEALSWGTPTVTTSAGNSGLDATTGTHLWVEDDAYMFAKRVCDLLHGIDWKKLSLEGRRLVSERFTWKGSIAHLEQHLVCVADNCK